MAHILTPSETCDLIYLSKVKILVYYIYHISIQSPDTHYTMTAYVESSLGFDGIHSIVKQTFCCLEVCLCLLLCQSYKWVFSEWLYFV